VTRGAGVTGFVHSFEALLAHYGIAAVFLTITLETLGAPLPGESALIAASAAAARGEFPIRAVVLAAFVASVLGDNIGYLIGRRLGREAILRHGRRFGVTEAAMAKAEAITARWGPLMVVVARFVVVLRQLNGLVAGTTAMPWPRFLAANIVGAALWVGVWTTLAWRFGHDTNIVPYLWHHLNLVAMVLVPLLILALVALHLRHRRA
jgi:membrane protein DedA with SNARE-associated domain